jgi:tellurite resistance protein
MLQDDPPLPLVPASDLTVPASTADAPALADESADDPAGPTLASVEVSLCERMQAVPEGPSRVVDLVTLVANADGTVDDAEREALARTLSVLLGNKLHAGLVDQLIRSSIEDAAREGVEARIAAVAEALRGCNVVEEGLLVGLAVAYSSFGLSRPERAVINALAAACGVPRERLAALIRRVRIEVDPGGAARG